MDTTQPQQNQLQPAARARQRLQDLITQLQEDGHRVGDPKTQAVFETSAEVLTGLLKLFSKLEGRREGTFPEQAGPSKLHGDEGDR